MPNTTTPQTAAALLEHTVKNDLANDTTDTSVVRSLVNKTLNERQQSEGDAGRRHGRIPVIVDDPITKSGSTISAGTNRIYLAVGAIRECGAANLNK